MSMMEWPGAAFTPVFFFNTLKVTLVQPEIRTSQSFWKMTSFPEATIGQPLCPLPTGDSQLKLVVPISEI